MPIPETVGSRRILGTGSDHENVLSCEAGRDIVRQINACADTPDEARSVNRYAAAILMPRAIIIDEARKINCAQWPNLYHLAERE